MHFVTDMIIHVVSDNSNKEFCMTLTDSQIAVYCFFAINYLPHLLQNHRIPLISLLFCTGVAFRGLPDVHLHPAVSAVYGNTEVSMVYLGQPLDG